MMKKVELLVGVFVLASLAALLTLGLWVSNVADMLRQGGGYTVSVPFDNIGGLRVRAPVTVGGVRIGRVSAIRLDDNYSAVVDLDIAPQFTDIPIDSFVSVRTMGLLGEQFVSVDPRAGGLEEGVWQDGTHIHRRYTQSAIAIDQLIGQALFKGN